MSTRVIGFKPPDKKWHKMKAIWDSCEEAGVDVPDEVYEFFEGNPKEEGQEIEILNDKYKDDMSEGIEIEVSDIPKDVKIIRFINSW